MGETKSEKKNTNTLCQKKIPFRKAVFRLCKSSEDKGHSSEALFDLGSCNHN